MPRFRKKQGEVGHFRFRRDEVVRAVQHGSDIQATFDGLRAMSAMQAAGFVGLKSGAIEVQYLGHPEVAKPGDWIIVSAMRGVHVCEEGVFRATYEPADRSEQPATEEDSGPTRAEFQQALEVLALGANWTPAVTPEDLTADEYEARGWLKTGRDETGEGYCIVTSKGEDKIRDVLARARPCSTQPSVQPPTSDPSEPMVALNDLRSFCEERISECDETRREIDHEATYYAADGACSAFNQVLEHFGLLGSDPSVDVEEGRRGD